MLLRWLKSFVSRDTDSMPLADTQRQLAAVRRAQGDLAGAESAYRTVLALDPADFKSLVKLGTVCLKQGKLSDARHALDAALQASPDYAEAHLRRGDLLLEQRQPDAAAASYREALRLGPGSARACVALGWALETGGDVDGGLAAYEQALALDPASVDAHVSRATLLLAREDYARGWDEFEWRRRAAANAPVHERFALPDWDGSPLAGRGVLFYAEQGLGDQIMYASCLPELIAQSARCVIDCDARLAALFARSFPQAHVHGGTQSDAGGWIAGLGLDTKVAAASAPRFLRRSPGDFPRHSGYLRADPAKVRAWGERLAALGPGKKVGLSWRGGVQRTGRAWRSLEPDALLPVLRCPGAHFVSLQYDARADEIAGLRARTGVEVRHWPEAIADYDETAALVCALDLTVSVCTAVIHLAGAQARPVWILAPVKPDARYGLEGDGMRWYPSARMFRQRSFGEWGAVVEAAAGELRAFTRP